MKRFTAKSRLVSIVGALFLLAASAAIIWYHRADPLLHNGLTVYTDPVVHHKVYTIEIANKSNTEIEIVSVTVNGKKTPERVQLGITYDSGHLVQFLGNRTNPATKFMDLGDSSIRPQLSSQEIQTALANSGKSNKQTPFSYGIVIWHGAEPLQNVTVRYSYLGFTKEKHINVSHE